MNEKRRELIFKVMDGDVRLIPVMYEFDSFVHLERMLQWCIDNKITGKNFYELYLTNFKTSYLLFGKWIVMKVNKESEMKPIYAGKDFRVR